jgi:hypothetical protein
MATPGAGHRMATTGHTLTAGPCVQTGCRDGEDTAWAHYQKILNLLLLDNKPHGMS